MTKLVFLSLAPLISLLDSSPNGTNSSRIQDKTNSLLWVSFLAVGTREAHCTAFDGELQASETHFN